jgi:hypothetical protein
VHGPTHRTVRSPSCRRSVSMTFDSPSFATNDLTEKAHVRPSMVCRLVDRLLPALRAGRLQLVLPNGEVIDRGGSSRARGNNVRAAMARIMAHAARRRAWVRRRLPRWRLGFSNDVPGQPRASCALPPRFFAVPITRSSFMGVPHFVKYVPSAWRIL